jgi:ElaB/YqjD/DUF883 family membrane-anchored ribosome-binding protein
MQEVKDRMKTRIEGAADAAKEGVDRASQSMHQFGQQAGSAVSGAVDKAKDMSANAMEGLRSASDTVKDAAVTAYNKTSDAAQYAAREASSLVRRYPISSVLTGLAIGLGVGCLLACTMRQRS